MRTRLMALAVSAVVSAPGVVLAQQANAITLYGSLNVDFESVKAAGGSAAMIPARNRVTSNAGTHLGIRGTEDLGGGLKAFFQLEMGFDPTDNTTGASALNPTPATTPLSINNTPVTGRNSAVGLQGGFGTLLLGRWDTPYKFATLRLDPNYTTIAAYTGTAHGNGGGTSGNITARFGFDRRQQNTVQYWTPTLGGFSARFGYGANEERTATVNPSLLSASAAWQNAVFYAGASYEQHKGYGSPGSRDKASQIFGQAKFGAFTLGLLAERLKYAGFSPASTASYKGAVLATSAGGGLEVSDWFASAAWQFGLSNVSLGYGRDQKVKLNGRDDGTRKARQISLRYAYDFSKRTQVYAMATKLDNGSGSANGFGFQTIGNTAGQDPKGFGVGINHRF